MTAPHRIDVHHHILPAEYVSALARIGITGGGGIPFPRWSVDDALGLMDRYGFGTDFPFAPEPVIRLTVDGLTTHDGFDAAARRTIERDNALALLPRLRGRVGGAGDG
jgi:hypothetical protein